MSLVMLAPFITLFLVFFEVGVVIWFFMRSYYLNRDITDFKVSKIIPLGFLIVSVLVGVIIIVSEKDQYGFVPLTERLSRAAFTVIMTNLTTPLFPVMEGMKQRKIETLKKG